MPAKSGASHALAAFLSIIIGAFISNFLSAHVRVLTAASERVGGAITGLTGAVVPEETAGLLVISTFLAFLWGVAYHYARQRTESGPKDYTSNTQQSDGNPPMTQHRGSGASEGEISPSAYRTVGTAWRADERLRTDLQRTLEEAKSRLDDVHDRCYDAEQRELADRVTSLVHSVTQAERTISRMTDGSGSSGQAADNVDEDLRTDLTATHSRVIEVGEDLLQTVRTAHEEAPEVADSRLDECEKQLRELERALADRQDHVRKLDETE